ncbi:MAG: transglycosylase, partial [Verrucomicrobiaceae bacterium]|nr:transglycosylase [Verrucomicrobiaceae bacterium]
LLADEEPKEASRLISEPSAWWIADILSDNQARALTFGTHSPLRLPFRVAAKTGTSTSYRDNWTLGYTPEFTVGVWAGNFEGKPMEHISGVTGAGPIFHEIFTALQRTHAPTWYAEPEGLMRYHIDPRTGKRLGPKSPPSRLSREEAFFTGTLPATASAADYDGAGRAMLSPEYATWTGSRDNWLGDLVTTQKAGPSGLHILHPVNGLAIRLDPDLPGAQQLLLQATPAEVSWSCGTLRLEQRGHQFFALLVPGEHQITASLGDQTARAAISVSQ